MAKIGRGTCAGSLAGLVGRAGLLVLLLALLPLPRIAAAQTDAEDANDDADTSGRAEETGDDGPGEPTDGPDIFDPFEPRTGNGTAGTGTGTSTGGDGTTSGPRERGASDRLFMDDGSLLDGRLVGLRNGRLRVATQSLGEVGVNPARVERVSLSSERVFYIQDRPGTESRAVLVHVGGAGQLTVREANASESRPLQTDSIYEMRSSPIPSGSWQVEGRAATLLNWGNANAFSVGLEVDTERYSRRETVEFGLGFYFAQTDQQVEQRLMIGRARYRYFPFEYLGAMVETRFLKDDPAGIEFRSISALGVVTRPFFEPDRFLVLGLSFAYWYQDLQGETRDDLSLDFSLAFLWTFSDRLAILTEMNFTQSINDSRRWLFRGMAELKVTVDQSFSLHVRFEDLWNGISAVGFNRNDARVLGLVSFIFDL